MFILLVTVSQNADKITKTSMYWQLMSSGYHCSNGIAERKINLDTDDSVRRHKTYHIIIYDRYFVM